ncbi:MAG: hypothetical protein JRN15_02135, partial [Nitrososphaerota archaeon]|nr:hypothetical protein [Nitrososphaerota archaeon]
VPPGQTVPFTGDYAGGSTLPFTLFNSETYAIEISSYVNVTFAYWQDNGNTNSGRSITLNGNIQAVAIYD